MRNCSLQYQNTILTYPYIKKLRDKSIFEHLKMVLVKPFSCGSASASVASITLQKDKKIKISSKGGNLQFASFKDKLKMTGPATNVFSGTID